MPDIKFTELNPPPDNNPSVDIYRNVDSFDLVSDPMEVTITVTGFDISGNPTTTQVTRNYSKSDWNGEEL